MPTLLFVSGHCGYLTSGGVGSASFPSIGQGSRRYLLFGGVWSLLYEDEIRSVEGPDALRGGPEGTAPLLRRRQVTLTGSKRG